MRERNFFQMQYVPRISGLEPMEFAYQELSDATVYRQPKQAVMIISDYIEKVYRDDRIFMQLTQCSVFIRYLDDISALNNNLLF